MSVIDLFSRIKIAKALTTTTISSDTTTNTAAVSVLNFDSNVIAIITDTITDGTYTFIVQDDDDPGFSSPTAVDASLVQGVAGVSLTSADSDEVFKIGYVGHKENWRVGIVSVSTTSGGVFSATSNQDNARISPVV